MDSLYSIAAVDNLITINLVISPSMRGTYFFKSLSPEFSFSVKTDKYSISETNSQLS